MDNIETRTIKLGDDYDGNVLSLQDAYRFRALLDEAVEQLDLLGMVMTDSSKRGNQNADKGSKGKDVYQLMVNQKELEDKYETLMLRRSQLGGLQNKSKYIANQAELKLVSAALRDSRVSIVHNLRDQPTTLSNIQKIQKDRAELQELLTRTGADMNDKSSFQPLVDDVNARVEHQRMFKETQLQHEKTRETLKALEVTMRAERDVFGKSIDEKNAEISALTGELKHLKKVSALTLKFEKDTEQAKQETTKRMNQLEIDRTKDVIDSVGEASALDSMVHEETVTFLIKQKDQLDQLYDRWNDRYGKEIEDSAKTIAEMESNHDADAATLSEFQSRWEDDSGVKTFERDEKKLRLTEDKNKKQLLQVMNMAQARVAFFYRVYTRKAGGGKKKKKGGSKKKGSKKKKK